MTFPLLLWKTFPGKVEGFDGGESTSSLQFCYLRRIEGDFKVEHTLYQADHLV